MILRQIARREGIFRAFSLVVHAANSSDRSGCRSISLSRHTTPPGGANRPCSQSRRVATGVSILSAKARCESPVFARAERTKSCFGVVTLPAPALTSVSAWRTSGNSMPASRSIARAIFCELGKMPPSPANPNSISMSHRLFNIAGRNVGLIGFGIHHHQNHNTLLGQVEINNSHAAALTGTCTTLAHLARPICTGNHVASQWVDSNPVNKRQPFGFRPDFLGLFLKSWSFDHCAHGLNYTGFPYIVNEAEHFCSFLEKVLGNGVFIGLADISIKLQTSKETA